MEKQYFTNSLSTTNIQRNQKRFEAVKKEIEAINTMNSKKIHPIYQTKKDFSENIAKGDTIMLDALKGIIVYGEETLINVMRK